MNNINGLNSSQVKSRVEKGDVNTKVDLPTRTIPQILKSNLFTVFNGINLVLAILVFLAGSPRNALFAIVIVSNTIMGIFQELKAKSTLEKLALMNKSSVKVIRDGSVETIASEDVVLDDVLILDSGDQIIADGFLISGEELSLDESSLTGESDAIKKSEGETILSGSFVTTGHGYMKVNQVSSNTYISKLSGEAKQFKQVESHLRDSVNRIVKTIVWIIFPLGFLLTSTQILFAGKSWRESLLGSVAGISGMLPEGLILLTTIAFLAGVIKLSKWNTLVQDLPATETLARIDTICLDKTGTITEGVLSVSNIINLNNDYSDKQLREEIAATVHSFNSENPTKRAITDFLPSDPNWDIEERLPFCSEKKYSAIRTSSDEIFLLGAPEVIGKNGDETLLARVQDLARSGKRVLLLARSKGKAIDSIDNMNLDYRGLIVLEDSIRSDAVETLAYLRDQKVDIKVISGDNPITVSSIANEAGVKNAGMYFDARELPEDEDSLMDVLKKYTVFGRVTPHQKRDIIVGLRRLDRTVAMTGDGVNDILALKESHCGIALSSGSESTKAVAQIVLLDSKFSNLPKVILEGRKIVNNLERVASLYLTKTIYSILLSFLFAITLKPYPFIPIQLTLMGSLAIGIPSFFLAFSPNHSKVERSFLYRLLSQTVPRGLTIALATFLSTAVTSSMGFAPPTVRTIGVLVAGGISFVVLFKTARPLSLYKIVLMTLVISLFSLAFILPLGRAIFSLSILELEYVLLALSIIGLSYFSIDIGFHLFRKLIPQK